MVIDESDAIEMTALLKRTHSGDVDAQRDVEERLGRAARVFLRGLDRPFALTPEHQLQLRGFFERYYERLIDCDPSAATTKATFFTASATAFRRTLLTDLESRRQT